MEPDWSNCFNLGHCPNYILDQAKSLMAILPCDYLRYGESCTLEGLCGSIIFPFHAIGPRSTQSFIQMRRRF